MTKRHTQLRIRRLHADGRDVGQQSEEKNMDTNSSPSSNRLSLRIFRTVLKCIIILTIVGPFIFMIDLALHGAPEDDTMLKIFVALWLIIGLSACIAFCWIGDEPKQLKADKYITRFKSFDQWKEAFYPTISLCYKLYGETSLPDESRLELFIKNGSNQENIACVALIRAKKLTDQVVENSNDGITAMLTEFCHSRVIRAYVDMLTVFCVDSVSSAFYKMVNCNVEQGLKNGRALAGISFGGQRIYVAKQKSGFAPMKYRKLRGELEAILKQMEGDLHSVVE